MKIKGIETNYIQYGKGKDIILLHGWGQNIQMMEPLGRRFEDKYKVTIIDFPGFGETEEPNVPWTINDYTEYLKELIKTLKIKKPIIMGHSFGGRVAINYTSKYDVEKLVLFGSPCQVSKKKDSLKTKTLKTLKKIKVLDSLGEKMKKYIGSTDYKSATPIMRETLVNTVNQDLVASASKIKVPTIIMWGDLDDAAPLEDAKKLEEVITDSGLIVFPGFTHYAYLENINQVTNILNEFL